MICRPRAITLLSLPQVCEVCGGRERIQIASPRASHSAVVPCLHCTWGIPVVHLTMREG